ncbi:MAG TPA: S8 family serine peptidase [Steroidobacteraceae bacterium]|nr:S8 family serine peptidase [Steroidobacteraceae bacterium]
MPESAWRVAVIDSGVGRCAPVRLHSARRFIDGGTHITGSELAPDPTGHGTAVARIIASAGVPIELCMAQVTDTEGRATPAAVAEALCWALAERAQLIHLSLGLRNDRAVLAGAIARAVVAGLVIVAATPARGVRTYPAAYPGVIRATGDARCTAEEISYLGTALADFGACAVHRSAARPAQRGASIGAAHLTRFILAHVPPATHPVAVSTLLARHAQYRGAERRNGWEIAAPATAFDNRRSRAGGS